MPIKDQNNLTIVRAAAGKLIPENAELVFAPRDLTSIGMFDGIGAPVTLPSKSAGQISSPNELTTLSDLRVGGARIITQENNYIVSSNSGGGFNVVPSNLAQTLLDRNTYTFIEDQGPPSNGVLWSVLIDFQDPVLIDSICIYGHNLGTIGASVDIETKEDTGVGGGNTSWLDNLFIESNDVIIATLDEKIEVQRITLRIYYDETDVFRIGGIHFGSMLEMPPIYGGHSPAILNRDTQYENNRTGTGNWVGRSIKRKGLRTSFSFRHIDPYFARKEILSVLNNIERYPFVIQWRPDKFIGEAIYCWTTDDPQLSNMGGGHDLMEMSLSVEGYRGL